MKPQLGKSIGKLNTSCAGVLLEGGTTAVSLKEG